MDAVTYMDTISKSQLGVLVSSALWGITSQQAVRYYCKFKSDMVPVKVAVGIVWLANTMYLILAATSLYQMIRGTLIRSLPLVTLIFGGVMQSVVQVVYAFRLYNLTHQRWIPIICCTGAAYEFISVVLYGILVLPVDEHFFVNQIKYRWTITSSFIVCPIVDIIITGTFCYQLRKDRQYIRRRTAHILDKLVLWTVQSGLITSLAAIAVVILDFALRDTGPFLALVVIVEPLYPVTLLALLNGRSQLRSMQEKANDDFTTFDLGVRTNSQGELNFENSIPANVSIGQQATDSSNPTLTIPGTGSNTDV